MITYILHMAGQFDWQAFEDFFYIMAPLLSIAALMALGGLVGGGTIGLMTVFAADLLLNGVRSATESLAVEITENPRLINAYNQYGILKGFGEGLDRAQEVYNRRMAEVDAEIAAREIAEQRIAERPIIERELARRERELQNAIAQTDPYIARPIAPIATTDWMPTDIDFTHPNWRDVSREELARMFGVDEEVIKKEFPFIRTAKQLLEDQAQTNSWKW